MQQPLKNRFEHGYIEIHKCCPDIDTVKDIIWAHPVSIDLLHAFSRILIIDCTCKTNRYILPLMEIVRVTSTEILSLLLLPTWKSKEKIISIDA